jgi:hypothetical protein
MRVIGTIAAAWLYVAGIAFFVTRFVLYVRLTFSRVGVRLIWSGIPGYLEQRYADAPEAIKVRLRSTFRIHQLLKRIFVWSLAAFVVGWAAALAFRTVG